MKTNKFILLVLLISFFTACQKDTEVEITTLKIANNTVNVTAKSADIECNIITHANVDEVVLHYAKDQWLTNSKTASMQKNATNTYNLSLYNLEKNTTYYYNIEVKNKYSSKISDEIFSFKTLQTTVATLSAPVITNITTSSALVSASVTNDGNSSITEQGLCYSTTPNPTINSIKAQAPNVAAKNFTITLSDLKDNTTYYVKAYAINGVNVAYSSQAQFTTLQSSRPSVVVNSVSSITGTSAIVNASVTNDGGLKVSERGICFSAISNSTIIYHKITDNNIGNGSFSIRIDKLVPNTEYYVRAYATNAKGTSYSQIEKSFTTQDAQYYFTVGNNKKIVFSQGNLQYKAQTNSWRFAVNQYDYVGDAHFGNIYENGVKCDNSKVSSTYSGWIDLFGWGTSGYNGKSPYMSSNNDIDYVSENSDISNTNYDWGVYNIIDGYPKETWRTMTYKEWNYLIYERNNAENLNGYARINYINGFILLPDNWQLPNGVSFSSSSEINFSNNVYTLAQWELLEQAGAVFFPTGGCRKGQVIINPTTEIGIWSSTAHETSEAYHFYILNLANEKNESVGVYSGRAIGRNVRLVHDVK